MAPTVRIGLDARLLMDPKGSGMRSFLYHLLGELWRIDKQNEYFLYATGPLYLPFDHRESSRWHLRAGNGINLVWMQTKLNLLARRDHLDVFLGTRHVMPYFLGVVSGRTARVSIIFDIFALTTPRVTPFKTWFYNISNTYLSCRLSHQLVATSESTKKDLIRVFGLDPARISVAYGGVDQHLFRPLSDAKVWLEKTFGINKKFILAGDVHNPRKNFASVLRAYGKLPERLREEYDIVGTGTPAPFYSSYSVENDLHLLGLKDNVKLVGLIRHQDMPFLYAGASLFVFPSLYEGFGLPVLEAMASGCPVITSTISSMPEVAEGAAFLVVPHDIESLHRRMRQILENQDVRSELVRKGTMKSGEFTWERYARSVLAACSAAVRSLHG